MVQSDPKELTHPRTPVEFEAVPGHSILEGLLRSRRVASTNSEVLPRSKEPAAAFRLGRVAGVAIAFFGQPMREYILVAEILLGRGKHALGLQKTITLPIQAA